MTASLPGYFDLQQFTDTGELAAGYRLYTFAPATTTQKVAFTDEAGTIPHTYTSDGIGGQYIALNSRGELPAPLFLTTGGYDIALKTPSGATVWTRRANGISESAEILTQALAADLASSGAAKGDELIAVKQAFTGSVARTQHDKNAEVPSVKDTGALGNGVAIDRAAIQAALNASKNIYIPDGTYYLGAFGTAENILDLSGLGDGISIRCGKNVEFVVNTTANVIPRVFYLKNNNNFHCDPIRFRDTGYNPLVEWKGAVGFFLDCSTSASWGDVTLPAIHSKNMVASVIVNGGNSTNRVRGIKIGQLFSDDCYYGFNAQNNGDGVVIDNLIAYKNYRPYFVYGCAGHRVNILNRDNRATSGAVNISRSVGGLNTEGLDITYVARDMTVSFTHVLVNHIDLLGGSISNIKVRVDIKSTVTYTPIRFVNYSGGAETTAASSNLVHDIDISGSCDAQASPVSAVAAYASKLLLTFGSGRNFVFAQSITDNFNLGLSSRNQAVAWTASSTNPVIGNGTLFGDYDVVGGMCIYTITLTAGSTTTFGSGEWSFSLPFISATTAIGSVFVFDNGTTYYTGVCRIFPGSNTVQEFVSGATSGFSSSVPMAWSTGDQLRLTITYPIG